MKVLKIPFSKGSLGKGEGSELAPEKICELLKEAPLQESGRRVTFEFVDVPVDPSDFSTTHGNVQLAAVPPFVGVGGDHSITYSLFKSFAERNPGAGIVVFDAHPDCMQPFDLPTHENFLRQLIEDGIVSPDRVILVGTRAVDEEELGFIRRSGLTHIPMKHVSVEGIENVCDAVMEAARSWDACYLSVDIDVVDPSAAPGTGYAEPAGLSSRELLYFIQRLKLLKNLGASDVVEILPAKDLQGLTVSLGAKIVNELS